MKLFAALAVSLFAACGGGGSPTDSVCPTVDPPTYANFGQQFFIDYCIGCHSATADDRHDAPNDQNFDTEAQIKAHADDIDTEAASGPSATNADMPDLDGPVHTAPTADQRAKLGQFLACERAGSS